MYKVLVADDEHNIRNILDFSLHAEGFLVVSALNGEDAFKLAVESKPDLVILDVMMPGQGGVETCRALKNDQRTDRHPGRPVDRLDRPQGQASRRRGRGERLHHQTLQSSEGHRGRPGSARRNQRLTWDAPGRIGGWSWTRRSDGGRIHPLRSFEP